MSTTSQYTPMSEERIKVEVSRVCKWAQNFVQENGYNPSDLAISETAVYQIITKVDQRKQYFSYFHHLDISDFKEIALYAFWIVKLAPLYFKEGTDTSNSSLPYESLNPKFAVYLIVKKVKSLANSDVQRNRINKFFSASYIYELVYSLTYRDISKEAMILLMETLAIGLGFDPYKAKV